MPSDEVDPRYAARFQRGFDAEAAAPVENPSTPEDADAGRPRRSAAALLVVAIAFAVAAVSTLIWLLLDPAFAPSLPARPGSGARAVVAAAPGPLLVGAVVALAAWARSHPQKRTALAAALGAPLVMGAALGAAASAAARFAALTANGPVSSGGIPLPAEAFALYQLRVHAAAVLLDLMPWLVLATVLALVGAAAAWVGRPRGTE